MVLKTGHSETIHPESNILSLYSRTLRILFDFRFALKYQVESARYSPYISDSLHVNPSHYKPVAGKTTLPYWTKTSHFAAFWENFLPIGLTTFYWLQYRRIVLLRLFVKSYWISLAWFHRWRFLWCIDLTARSVGIATHAAPRLRVPRAILWINRTTSNIKRVDAIINVMSNQGNLVISLT